MPTNAKNIGIAVAAVIVLGGVYWYFFTGGQEGTDPAIGVVGVGSPIETRFLELAGELQPVSFDTKIFSDPRFAALTDLTTPIAPETSGRTDPFAPAGR